MSDKKSWLFVAFLAGVAVMSQVAANFGTVPYVMGMINDCEKSLPRSHTCVLISIPKQETIQEK